MVRQSRASPAPASLVILTRPAEQGAGFAALLSSNLGPDRVIVSPLMATDYLQPDVWPGRFASLILTSPAAVEALRRLSRPLPPLAYCVGRRTADEARKLGLAAVAAAGDADGLVRLLLEARPAGPLLHLHGRDTRGAIAERLNLAGIETVSCEIYHQVAQGLTQAAVDALHGRAPILLPVFSPRSAGLLAAELRQVGPSAPLHFVAISAAAAASLGDFSAGRVTIAETPDAEAMFRAMERVEWGASSD